MIKLILNNMLFILVIVYIIFMTLRGHKKGFFRIAISTISIVITLFFSSIIFPKIDSFIKENTAVENGISNIMLNNIGVENVSISDSNDEMEQEEAINSLSLPKNIKKALIRNNNSESYSVLGVQGFKEYLSKYVSETILNIIIFVIVSAVIWIVLHIVMEILDIFAKVPVIHGLNQILGALVGFSNALIILWILSLFVGALAGTPIGINIMQKIESNWLLSVIFDNNLISLFMQEKLYGKF